MNKLNFTHTDGEGVILAEYQDSEGNTLIEIPSLNKEQALAALTSLLRAYKGEWVTGVSDIFSEYRHENFRY